MEAEHKEAPDGKKSFSLTLQQIAAWQFPDLVGHNANDLPLLAGIPSLQRGAVWNPGQVELLWDSIFRGFPIGSFVVCDKIKDQRTRPGRYGVGWLEEEIPYHLLDGQQRCNAIALGFLDPFHYEDHVGESGIPPAIIWLDLRPPKLVAGSTRKFLFRILTTPHPWGYQRNDDANRLGVAEIRDALEKYKRFSQGKILKRADLSPHLSWPPVGSSDGPPASATIPLAWLLNNHLIKKLDGQSLWAEIAEHCEDKKHSGKPWAKAAIAFINSEPAHLEWIARGLGYARKLSIVTLKVPRDSMDVPPQTKDEASDEKEDAEAGIADIEHLFARLNGAGTALQGEELAYSMIKAYWAGVEQSFDALRRARPFPMSEASLAGLGARAALIDDSFDDSAGQTAKLPPVQSVTALRRMARNPQRRRIVGKYLGIGDDLLLDCDLFNNLALIDEWILYSHDKGKDDYGLPPVLRTAVAQEAPEVFLLLLYLAQLARRQQLGRDSITALRVPIIALTTTLHWFGYDRGVAVDFVFDKLLHRVAKKGLTEDSFCGILTGCVDLPEGKRGILMICSPQELEEWIPKAPTSDRLDEWKDWNLYKLMVSNVTQEEQLKTKREKYDWPFFDRLKKSKSHLLLYAQRSYLNREFTYDPSLRDTWKEHNRPWDYDHILPAATTYSRGRANTCKMAIDEWMPTIGNLRAWPLEKNRAKSADSARKTIITDQDIADSVLQSSKECDDFSIEHGNIGLGNCRQAAKFMDAARYRLLRIYRSWYVELRISNIVND